MANRDKVYNYTYCENFQLCGRPSKKCPTWLHFCISFYQKARILSWIPTTCEATVQGSFLQSIFISYLLHYIYTNSPIEQSISVVWCHCRAKRIKNVKQEHSSVAERVRKLTAVYNRNLLHAYICMYLYECACLFACISV